MQNPPDQSSSQHDQQSSLEVGLAAFKQADYATAIPLLEAALTSTTPHPLKVKAQMGLAIAYIRTGQAELAIPFCQTLQHHAQPDVQEWAQRTLANLLKRYPELANPSTAPTPQLDTDRSSVTPLSVTPPQTSASSTGFVPLNPTDLASLPSQSLSSLEEDAIAPPITPELAYHPVSQPTTVSEEAKPTPQIAPKAEHSDPQAQPEPETVSSAITPAAYQPEWRQAGRASRWKPLSKIDSSRLWLVQVGSAIGLLWLIQQTFALSLHYLNTIITRLPFLTYSSLQIQAPIWLLPALLLGLGLGSRWILDAILGQWYGLKSFSLEQLANHSPEAAQSLPYFCRQRKLPLPTLGILPTKAPVLFTYGALPRISRIVASQGLLEQLAEDEIAALYAVEIGHLAHRTVPLLSTIVVTLQIPYLLYRSVANWGNAKTALATKISTTIIASASYGLYRLWRWVGLALARYRILFGDRVAANLTGNPNGLTRAILKLAIGIANDVTKQGKTSDLLESFDLIMPLSHRTAITLGSFYAHTPLDPILDWERRHPLRNWMTLNSSHPLTGDRLNLLSLYARHWKLDSELKWPALNNRSGALTRQQWITLLHQGAPFWGVLFGGLLALLLEQVGRLGQFQPSLSWLYNDPSVFYGLILVGLGLGTLVRINALFPDIKRQADRTKSSIPLSKLISASQIPIQGQPVYLQGKLLGRPGINSALNQQLILKTPGGMLPIHATSAFGAIGDILQRHSHPSRFTGQEISITGWLRRGSTLWVDISSLRTNQGKLGSSNPAIWNLLLASTSILWGIYSLYSGRFWF